MIFRCFLQRNNENKEKKKEKEKEKGKTNQNNDIISIKPLIFP